MRPNTETKKKVLHFLLILRFELSETNPKAMEQLDKQVAYRPYLGLQAIFSIFRSNGS